LFRQLVRLLSYQITQANNPDITTSQKSYIERTDDDKFYRIRQEKNQQSHKNNYLADHSLYNGLYYMPTCPILASFFMFFVNAKSSFASASASAYHSWPSRLYYQTHTIKLAQRKPHLHIHTSHKGKHS